MENEKTKEEVKDIEIKKPVNPDEDLLPKNGFGKFMIFISDKFLKPSVITVFVTALLGPLAIGWVNNSIENKNLQKEVIQTLLTYTSEADFSKPESIEKIGIISQMVDENKSVFGLTFTNTNKAITMLNEVSNDVGIKNLTQKLRETEKNIIDFKAKLKADSAIHANFIIEKEKLISGLETYKKLKNKTKISEYENKIAKNDLDITEVNNNRTFHENQLKYWFDQQSILETDIKNASENLSEVLKNNRSNQELLAQQKDTLKIELARAWNDINALKLRIGQLESENKIIKDSLNTFIINTSTKKK